MPNIDAGLMARKHAQDFLRSLEIKDPNDFAAYSLEWSDLAKKVFGKSCNLGSDRSPQ
jgi:hypothetical protein